MIIEITSENFNDEVINSGKPVLLDFWASWCGPCRALSPIVDQVANENLEKVKVGKVNIDEQQLLAEKFGIMSIPTLILIKNGKEEKRVVGLQSMKEILKMLE